jgi:hypothetical protein
MLISVPWGQGIDIFWPAALLATSTVSSALYFGTSGTCERRHKEVNSNWTPYKLKSKSHRREHAKSFIEYTKFVIIDSGMWCEIWGLTPNIVLGAASHHMSGRRLDTRKDQ